MDTETFIRDSARRGLSRTATREALGLSASKFRQILEVMGPIDWPAPGRSLDNRLASERQRGRAVTASQLANLEKAKAVQLDRCRRTVRGVRGTVRELVAAFPEVNVSASRVAQRMREGMDLEEALFTPRQPWCRPNQRGAAFVRNAQ